MTVRDGRAPGLCCRPRRILPTYRVRPFSSCPLPGGEGPFGLAGPPQGGGEEDLQGALYSYHFPPYNSIVRSRVVSRESLQCARRGSPPPLYPQPHLDLSDQQTRRLTHNEPNGQIHEQGSPPPPPGPLRPLPKCSPRGGGGPGSFLFHCRERLAVRVRVTH